MPRIEASAHNLLLAQQVHNNVSTVLLQALALADADHYIRCSRMEPAGPYARLAQRPTFFHGLGCSRGYWSTPIPLGGCPSDFENLAAKDEATFAPKSVAEANRLQQVFAKALTIHGMGKPKKVGADLHFSKRSKEYGRTVEIRIIRPNGRKAKDIAVRIQLV